MIEPYIAQMEANGLSPHTIKATRQCLTKLNDFKPLNKVTKADLIKFFKDLDGTDEVRRLHQSKIKKFFKDIDKPELVEWIKPIKIKESITADEILTPEDINRLLGATEGHYWKALIAFLFESGSRISEAMAVRYKDFKETNDGMVVDIPTTKTASGFRRMLLIMSAEYIRNLKIYTSLDANDHVFNLSDSHMETTLKKIAKKAGINKPVNPHAFRHASATLMVQQGMQEAIIRKKLGWTPNSSMISRYQHLNDNAVVEAITGKKFELRPVEITQPKKVSLVDAGMQLSKLNEENQDLRSEIEQLKSLVLHLVHKDSIEEAIDEAQIHLDIAKAGEQRGQSQDEEWVKENEAIIEKLSEVR